MKERSKPTLFASLLESCTRFSFYPEILDQPLSRAFSFLSLLAALSAISFTLYAHQVVIPSLDRASDKLPVITIKNGKVSLEGPDAPKPTGILYADPKKVLRIDANLDNSKESVLPPSDYDYTILITKYTVILKRVTGQSYSFSLPYGFSLTIDKHSLHFFLHWSDLIITLVIFLGSFFVFWGLKFVEAFLLSIPGLIIWGVLRRDLTYDKLFGLCIYTLAPATLFSIMVLWLNSRFLLPVAVLQYEWAISFVIALEFLLGGLIAERPPRNPAGERTLVTRMI